MTRTGSTGSAKTSRSTAVDDAASSPMEEAGQKAGKAASDVVDSAKSTATERANMQKERVASGIQQVAEAIHRVSGELRVDQPAVASVADTAAQQAERIGSFLRESDVNQLVRNTEDFARRQPLIFYGGAFAIGLLASRFLKAGASQQNGGRSWQATGPGRTGSTYSGYQTGLAARHDGESTEPTWRPATSTGV
ncbi:MAG TPA: hypothetical protein VHK28_08925 [Candidatus Limnocylindria bacterium]|nr:hypothetical protein [Candidatus Limnocylindria bacterium]